MTARYIHESTPPTWGDIIVCILFVLAQGFLIFYSCSGSVEDHRSESQGEGIDDKP